MDLEIGCLVGNADIKDYNLVDALQRIGQQKGETLKFAIFNFREFSSKVKAYKEENNEEVLEGFIELSEIPQNKEKGIDKTEFQKSFSGGNVFRKYKLRIECSSNCEIDSSSVLIPLSFYNLEQQATFSLELRAEKETDGEVSIKLVLRKKQADEPEENIVGNVIIKDEKFVVEGDDELATILDRSELTINQNGKITVQQKPNSNRSLYLGIGFTKYTMDIATDWSPVEQQSPGHLCAANAGVALMEYFERKSQGRHLDASRLFLHKVACDLLHLPATSATTVRSVVRALKAVGVAPEEYHPYDLDKLNDEPSALCYALANNYRAGSYFCLDRPGMDRSAMIAQIKVFVYAGLPVIFGFPVYDSIEQSYDIEHSYDKDETAVHRDFPLDEDKPQYRLLNPPGSIPFPVFSEIYRGGHAAVIVGYDDDVIIVNRRAVGRKDREAFAASKTQAFLMDSEGMHGEAVRWDERSQAYRKTDLDEFPQSYRVDSTPDLDFPSYKFPHPAFSGLFTYLKYSQSQQDISNKTLLTPKNCFPRIKPQDSRRVPIADYVATRGAFKIRNSWGQEWGDQGYGWLPYAYVYRDLAFDFWSILKFEWLNSEDFGLLRQNGNLVMCPQGTPGNKC